MLTVTSKYYLHANFILAVVNFSEKLTSRKQVKKIDVRHGNIRGETLRLT